MRKLDTSPMFVMLPLPKLKNVFAMLCSGCGVYVVASTVKRSVAETCDAGCIRGLFLAAICLVCHPSFAANPASAISIKIPIINNIQPASPSFLCAFHPPKNLLFSHSAIYSKTRPINTNAPPVVAQIKSQNWSDDEIAKEKRKLDAFWCKCICFLVFICCGGIALVIFCNRH